MKKIYVMLCLVFLLTLASALADLCPDNDNLICTDNPKPTITVVYDSADAPVRVKSTDYELLNSNFDPVAIELVSVDGFDITNPDIDYQGKTFVFRVNQFLTTDTYSFAVEGEILSELGRGTIHQTREYIQVDYPGMIIWVSEPRVEFIHPPERQDIAISDSVPFTFEISTEQAATCRLIRSERAGEFSFDELPQLYQQANVFFNNGNTQEQVTHSINVNLASEIVNSQTEVSLLSEFNYRSYLQSAAYIVVCKQESIDQPIYSGKEVFIGYDTTPPTITAEFTPELISDGSYIKSNLSVVSSDDLVFCSYGFSEFPPRDITKINFAIGNQPFQSVTQSIHDYNYVYERLIEFDYPLPQNDPFLGYLVGEEYDFTSTLTCTNPAGLNSETTADVQLNLDNVLFITPVNNQGSSFSSLPAYTDTFPELSFRTNLLSRCWYDFGSGLVLITGDEYDVLHTFSLNIVEDGYDYSVQVQCETPNAIQESITYNFAVDTVSPETPQIVSESFACSSLIPVTIEEPALGNIYDVVKYEIELYEDSRLIGIYESDFTSSEFTIDSSFFPAARVIGGLTYEYKIKAIDGVGRESTVVSVPIERLYSYEPRCDTQTPSATVDAILTENGYEVRVICADFEQNCAPTYSYGLTALGSSCNDVVLTDVSSSFVITFEDEQRVCYQVADQAIPVAHVSEVEFTDIGRDINILLENPESGISQVKEFDLLIRTKSKESNGQICKHGPQSTTSNQLVAVEDYSALFALEELDVLTSDSTATQHSTFISGATYPQFDSTQDSEVTPWLVVCKENNANVYSVKEFDLGYDTTPPSIEVSVNPVLVADPESMFTNLVVRSDENVFCEYRDQNTLTYTSFEAFAGQTYGKYSTYDDLLTTFIEYDEYAVLDALQLVRCYNLADQVSTATVSYSVDAEHSYDITVLSDQYQPETRFLFEVSTGSTLARCKFRKNGGNFLEFAEQTNLVTRHQHNIQLSEGTHLVELECSGSLLGRKSASSTIITVDTTDPEVFAVVKDTSCSADVELVSFGAHSDGSPITTYGYNVSDGTSIIYSTNEPKVSETIPITLESGVQYSLIAYANEESGRSATYTTTFFAQDLDPSCDAVKPSASIETKGVWGGVEVTILCSDNVGCSYAAYSLDPTGTCEDVDGRKLLSMDETGRVMLDELIEESTTLCYQVIDEVGNPSDIESEFIEVVQSCYNKQEDTTEDGVDCGGICSITCEEAASLCFNEIQDDYEQGVDCGGVCSRDCALDPQDEVIREPTINDPLVLSKPVFGISATKAIDLEVKTITVAECRYGFLSQSRPELYADWFRTLTPFALSTGLLHQEYLPENSVSQLNYDVDSSETNYVVLCRFEDNSYAELEIVPFGFDTSLPELTVYAVPNPVVDPGNMRTTLYVESTDPVVCTYLEAGSIPRYFPNNIISDETTYVTEHSVTLSYWGKDRYTDYQTVSCRSLSQKNTKENYLIEVSPTNAVDITILNDGKYYSSSALAIEVETAQLANCQYRFSEDESYTFFSQTGGNNHVTNEVLTEGDYTIEVQCTGLGSGELGIKFGDFVIDQTAPQGSIANDGESCSLNSLSFTISADGTGSPIDKYQYSIQHGATTLITRNTSSSKISYNGDLVAGEVYGISVIAFDSAGNLFNMVSDVTASSSDSLSCDDVSPEALIDIIPVYGGVQINLTCVDSASGCTSDFRYSIGESCGEELSLSSYVNLPLFSSSTGTFCYEVTDLAGNTLAGEEDFVVLQQCFNGIEDPDEDGVDCGGPCSALCTTCSNGVQDTFEDGVDCGGICSVSCSLIGSQFEGNEDKGETPVETIDSGCQVDADCAFGERCNLDGQCVFDSSSIPPIVDTRSSSSGLILLLVGVLLSLGGGGYVYYSRTQLNNSSNSPSSAKMSEEQRKAQAALAKQQEEARKKREKELLEKKRREDANRLKHIKERKEERDSLLGIFGGSSAKKPETQKTTSTSKQSEKEESTSKEDDDGYVDLTGGSKKSIFDKLSDVGKDSKDAEKAVNSFKEEEPPSPSSSKKKGKQTVFDKLDEVSGRKPSPKKKAKKDTFKELSKVGKKK